MNLETGLSWKSDNKSAAEHNRVILYVYYGVIDSRTQMFRQNDIETKNGHCGHVIAYK